VGDIALDGRVERVAPILGRFLSWLHAFDTADAIRLGVPERDATELISEMQADASADFDNLKAVSPDAPLRRWRRFLDEMPAPAMFAPTTPATAMPARPVLVHGDLAAEHVLYDVASDRVTGVIDWSEIAVSDATVDLRHCITPAASRSRWPCSSTMMVTQARRCCAARGTWRHAAVSWT
jgi:aminoglycoside phosphotransferase (APT) family kinase protein